MVTVRLSWPDLKLMDYHSLVSRLRVKADELARNEIEHTEFSGLFEDPLNQQQLLAWAHHIYSNLQGLLISKDDLNDLLLILIGMAASKISGTTPEICQHAQIRTYCKTNGLLQDILAIVDREISHQSQPILTSSIFSQLPRGLIPRLLKDLRAKGYISLPVIADNSSLMDIENLCRASTEQWILVLDGESSMALDSLDPENPPLSCIRAMKNIDITSAAVKKLAHDPILKLIVDAYLGSSSELIRASLWHSYPGQMLKPSSEAAQQFHFDLDTHKFVKVFIYLSDVGPENGPHVGVLGTHLSGSKNHVDLAKLYARIPDEQIHKNYNKVTAFTGGRGTTLIADTRAYHKGSQVVKGRRSLIQFLYSSSTFALNFCDE